MTVHIIKLAVGPANLAELAARQTQHLNQMRRAGQAPELMHVTRAMPKRADEVLDGGSLYWVIAGWLTARQKLLDLRPVLKDGIPHCGLVYDPQIITVRSRQHRPFQGWRYLQTEDAPPDLGEGEADYSDMPEKMRRELREMGLI